MPKFAKQRSNKSTVKYKAVTMYSTLVRAKYDKRGGGE
uniref:Uncharacterized protein n=1 Tax=Anguilla anguilla TaxID=7936 RepID=A0A0E9RYC9_ANGAN